jgi:formylglycine-generating enzyme required for sulfatase activity
VRKSILILTSLLVLFALLSCEQDEPTRVNANDLPEIIGISADPPQLGKGQSTTLFVQATDINKDELQYQWSSEKGVYLQGMDRKFAVWQAPQNLGRYECKVAVSDGKETAIGTINIDVIDVPLLRVSTNELDLSYNLTSVVFTIRNDGLIDLDWQITSGKDWIAVSQNSGSLKFKDTSEVVVTANRENLIVGDYTGLIAIRSNGGAKDIAAYMEVAISSEMAHIPAGEFIMGSENGNEDEIPVHNVVLEDYWIDKYEVTNAQYATFLNEAKAKGEITSGLDYVKKNGKFLMYQVPINRDRRNVGCPIYYVDQKYVVERHEANTPARFITWYGALAYAQFYDKRLPTEAEWEKAARGSNANAYPWGESAPTKWDCNYNENLGYLAIVGNYSPLGESPYGCADMAGNVWEWCNSLYKEYPYNKDDGREDISQDGYRVLRGGSWDGPVMNIRSALRSYNETEFQHPSFGFRCAK